MPNAYLFKWIVNSKIKIEHTHKKYVLKTVLSQWGPNQH